MNSRALQPRLLPAELRGCAPLRTRQAAAVPSSARGASRCHVFAVSRVWRTFPGNERVGERALRMQEASRREHLLPDNGEPIADVQLVQHVATHPLDASVLRGKDNQPQSHHHEIPPPVPVPHTSLLALRTGVPPPIRVQLRPFPAGILTQALRPALAAAVTLEGPVALTSTALAFTAIVVGAALLLGRLGARRRAGRSPEEPLFKGTLGRRMPWPPRL